MSAGEEKSGDFYGVLGLKKECTEAELRIAYKKLALKWHPDRCSASGNLKYVEEAKKKFQAIQEAYSVLSDANKRFMYDVGVYDSDGDENGMGDFLSEMAAMMHKNKSNEHGESFEELQQLFEEMFQRDIDAFGSASQKVTSSSCCSSYNSCSESSNTTNNKHNSSKMNVGKTKVDDSSSFDDAHFEGFCFGAGHRGSLKGRGANGGIPGGGGNRRRNNSSNRKISSKS